MQIVIDATTVKFLERLKVYAENNPLSMDDVLDMKNKQRVLGKEHVVIVPVGVRIMFTIEWQVKGMARHMSASLMHKPGKLPHPEAIKMIMPHLGFVNALENCFIYTEEFRLGHEAIDIVEYINGPSRR